MQFSCVNSVMLDAFAAARLLCVYHRQQAAREAQGQAWAPQTGRISGDSEET